MDGLQQENWNELTFKKKMLGKVCGVVSRKH